MVINTIAEKDNTMPVRYYLLNISKQMYLFFEVVFGLWLSQVVEFGVPSTSCDTEKKYVYSISF